MRIGLIGAGYIAAWHIAAIKRLKDSRVTAICDADVKKARRLAEPLGARWFQSVPELLDGDTCDSVHVLLPPQLHARVAIEAIEAEKHVFIEKPMCLTSDECRSVIEAASSHRVKVGVNHNFLCLPSVDKLSWAIKNRMLGPIDHLTVDWMASLGQLKSGALNSWLFASPYNAFFEVASHPLAFVAYLLGDVNDVVVHASDRIEFPGGKAIYGRWQIVGETVAGAGFTVRVSLTDGFPQRRVEVRGFGGRATVTFDRDVFSLERFSRHDIILEPFLTARALARQINREAWRNLRTQAISLDKLSPFGLSLSRSVNAFRSMLQGQPDERISAELGRNVIDLAERCVAAAEYVPSVDKSLIHGAGSITAKTGHASEATPSIAEPAEALSKGILGKVLVIGGSGFIGSHLVRQLAAAGYEVRAVCRRSCPELHGYMDRVHVVVGSIHDSEFLDAAVGDVDYVYHLARPAEARTWNDYVTDDIGMTRIVAEACCKPHIRRFVYTGTTDSYYSGAKEVISERTGLDPRINRRNLYARSKAECENILQELHRDRGLALVVARPGIVIGRGGNPQHPGVGLWPSPTVCLLWGRGDNKLPFVLVEDVAAALVRMLDSPGIVGEDYNLVGDALLDARQYVAAYEEAINCQVQVYSHSIWRYFIWDCLKNITKTAFGRGNVRVPSYADWRSRTYAAEYVNLKAKEHLKWQPNVEPDKLIKDGIEAAVQQFFKCEVH